MAKVFTSNSVFIDWWLSGLSVCIPPLLKNILSGRHKRIVLSLDGDRLTILWPADGKLPSEMASYDLNEITHLEILAQKIAVLHPEQLSLVLYLPDQSGLRKVMHFPANAEQELGKILHYEIEKITPFTADQVYHSHRVISKDKISNQLRVELHVVPRRKLDEQLAVLSRVNLIPQRVELDSNGDEEGLNLLPANSQKQQSRGLFRYLNLAIIFGVVCMLILQVALPFHRLNTAIAVTQNELKQVRSQAMQSQHLRKKVESAQDRKAIINEKLGQYQPITLILNEMTTLLPNDTWLMSFTLNKREIQMKGKSAAASSLIARIESSEYFTNTRFRSPVFNSLAGKEEFNILTRVVHSQALTQLNSAP